MTIILGMAVASIAAAGFMFSPTPANAPTEVSSGGHADSVLIGMESANHRTAFVSRDYGWPSGKPVKILKTFHVGAHPWDPGHRGVDLDMAEGDAVYAANDGDVIYAGLLVDRQVVSIQHPDGIRTTYEPIIPLVIQGQHVTRGTIIGTIDGTHCAPRSCLHWGAKKGKKNYINPLSLLEGQIVLLE
ncbi:M23 family metallopeptidase [Arcanobacterium haemolyticum]